MGRSTKQSIYFPKEMLKEIREVAEKQERTMSWMVQKAWKIARATLKKGPVLPPIKDRTQEQ